MCVRARAGVCKICICFVVGAIVVFAAAVLFSRACYFSSGDFGVVVVAVVVLLPFGYYDMCATFFLFFVGFVVWKSVDFRASMYDIDAIGCVQDLYFMPLCITCTNCYCCYKSQIITHSHSRAIQSVYVCVHICRCPIQPFSLSFLFDVICFCCSFPSSSCSSSSFRDFN